MFTPLNRRNESNRGVLIIIIVFTTIIVFWLMFVFGNGSASNLNRIVFETYEKVPAYSDTELQRINEAKKCFQLNAKTDEINFLDDIMQSSKKPEPNKCIFFHVTSCSTTGRIELTARQACAIESAAKWNPYRDVFVLFAAPVGFVPNESISSIMNALLAYPNIHFRNLNLRAYSVDTPAEDWIKTDKLFLSSFLIAHTADYLRFLTLYRFGGIYFDLDVIVQKNLDEMPPNFAGAESANYTAIGAMGFEADDVGHKIVEMIVRENIENYKPEAWSYSGPGAITRVLERICHRNYVADLKPEFCWGFKVFPKDTFYAIHWQNWNEFFDPNPAVVDAALKKTKNSIAVHVWNKLSAKQPILKSGAKTVYGILAENNCPNVFGASGLYF